MAYETSVSYLLNTTDDNVVETPDETLTVSIYVPGMFPSYLGDLIASVSIEVGVEALVLYSTHLLHMSQSITVLVTSAACSIFPAGIQ